VQLGTFLSAPTTRLASSPKQNLLRSSTSEEGSALDYYQWGGVLRASARFGAYSTDLRRRHHGRPRVAELLVLKPEMPARCAFARSGGAAPRRAGGGRVLDSRRSPASSIRACAMAASRISPGAASTISFVEFMDRVSVLSDGISRDFLMFREGFPMR